MDLGSITGIMDSPVMDSILSASGAMAVTGGALLLYSTTAIRSFFSGGTKGWLTPYSAWRAGLYGDPKKGIILGRYRGKLVCYEGNNDVLVVGTKGTGKSVSTFDPTIASNTRHGMLVYDQSGNLFKRTSGARAKVGPGYRINPDVEDSDSLNLLDMIPGNIEMDSSLRALYEPFFDGSTSTVKKTGGDPHWPNEGLKLLVFSTKHVLLGDSPEYKNISSILSLMSNIWMFLKHMVEQARDESCRDVARAFMGSGERYCGNVMSNIDQSMSVFRDPSVARITSYSSFHIEDLAASTRGPITVYLTAPAVKVKGLMPFYVGIEQAMKLHLMKDEDFTLNGRKKLHPVMVLDDEAQNTNRPNIDILEVARKFKVSYFFGAQSYEVMRKMYGDKLNLFKTKVLFRSPDGDEDMKAISAISGKYRKKEVRHSSDSRGSGRSSSGKSWNMVDAPRLTEREVGEWGPYGIALLSVFGYNPAVLSMFDSSADKQFKHLFIEPHRSEAASVIRSHWHSYSSPVLQSAQVSSAKDEAFEQIEASSTSGKTVVVAF